MINFFLFFFALVVLNSIRSLNNYMKISTVFNDLKFYKFKSFRDLLIANDGTKDEFVVVSDWHYRLPNNFILHLDIWTLVDFHQLYWLFKFRNYFKDKNSNKGGVHILFS